MLFLFESDAYVVKQVIPTSLRHNYSDFILYTVLYFQSMLSVIVEQAIWGQYKLQIVKCKQKSKIKYSKHPHKSCLSLVVVVELSFYKKKSLSIYFVLCYARKLASPFQRK